MSRKKTEKGYYHKANASPNGRARRRMPDREWYSLRSIMGYSWAMFYFLLGGREAGKSYAVTDMYVRQWKKYKRPFYWMRLTESSQKKLLTNKAEKLIDPDLRRKYDLDLTVKGDGVYDHGELMARVMAISTFYNDKGSGLFDKDFLNDPTMYYNICLDEMNREANEKRSFDIVYAFTNQLENVVRSTKKRVRVICIGNTLQEASDLLCAFNFIPEEFGRFKLRKKRAVIEYIQPSEKYLTRRKGTIADILSPDSSTFTNQTIVDTTLLFKGRLGKPMQLIKFGKEESKWFVVYENNVIAQYVDGHQNPTTVIAMKPYLATVFIPELRDSVINLFDMRVYRYKNLITQKLFQKELEIMKPRKNG